MDQHLLDVFREESLERVARMASTLVAAEEDGLDPEAIAALLRDAHSIKGSAGMFGLDRVAALAAAMEDVLGRSRDDGASSPRSIPALLGGTDAIRAAVTDGPREAPRSVALEVVGDRALEREAAPPRRRVSTEPTLRVRAEKVDRLLASVGEAALHGRRVEYLTRRAASADEALYEELEHGRTLVGELQDAVLDLRTLPLNTLVAGLTRAVHDAAADVGRDVRLELFGTETPLDRAVLDGVGDALVHLLRNAIAHGIEAPAERVALAKPPFGTIRLGAEQRGRLVALTCSDDGRGVPADVLARVAPGGTLADLLAAPGFTTAEDVSALAGRGVGLDAVKRHIEGLGGLLEISSVPGAGTTVTLLVPLTLAIVTVLLVERGDQRFGIPLSGVDRVLRGPPSHQLHGRRGIDLDGEPVPLADLADVLGMDAPATSDEGPVVVVAGGSQRAGIRCDRLLGDREVVVKSLGTMLAHVDGYVGAAILESGAIALLLDPAHLVRLAGAVPRADRRAAVGPHSAPMILVVDDRLAVRELERTILESAGYRVCTAEDGRAALAMLAAEPRIACVLSDVEMPVMDGLELLCAIRAQPESAALPVIVVTARDDDETLARGADAGADAWVVKSRFEQRDILDAVGRLVGPC